jgi:hypothetical protein
MAGNVRWDERAIADFTHDVTAEAIQIVTERVADDARVFMPVADFVRYPAPGHTRTSRNPFGESWPPGRMRESVSTDYGDGIDGMPYGDVKAIYIYGIAKGKKRHGIRPAITDALEAQRGRPVP